MRNIIANALVAFSLGQRPIADTLGGSSVVVATGSGSRSLLARLLPNFSFVSYCFGFRKQLCLGEADTDVSCATGAMSLRSSPRPPSVALPCRNCSKPLRRTQTGSAAINLEASDKTNTTATQVVAARRFEVS